MAVYDDNGTDLIVAYRYDATGRRILKALDDDADGDIDNSGGDRYEHFFHTGQQVIETREATTSTAAPETLDPTYQNVWSPRYIDALILRDTYTSGVLQSGERIFYLTDANYNVTAVVDANGDVVERYVYDAYGNATLLNPNFAELNPQQSTVNNTTLYTGRELDKETGLYFYRARYYHAQLGRFVARDPIEDDINLYRYVGNNPTIYTDSTGLSGSSSSSGGSGGSESCCSSSDSSTSGGVSPPHQACSAWANGASLGAIWDATPWGTIGSDASKFGKEWQKKHGGDSGNAARHGYWQAMLACQYGANQATAIGNAHECGQECSVDSRTDQFNNDVARQIGAAVGKPCDKDKIRKAVENALNQGKFITDQKKDPRIPPAPKGCECKK